MLAEKASAIIEKIRQSTIFIKIREQPIAILPLIFVTLLIILFWSVLWQTAVVLAIVGLVILSALKLFYSEPTLKELTTKKQTLLHEIDILEKKYMKRKISKKDFLDAFRKKQTALIRLEALIDEKFNREKLNIKTSPVVKELTTKKRHIVASLLEEKKITLKEMEIAQKMYLKRKIDAATYQKLLAERQQRLIELEAQLKQIYGEESVAQVMRDLKKRLADVEKQMKEQKQRELKKRDELEAQIAAEIAEQVGKLK